MEKIQAIDFMYYVATREFMENWDRAKEGELVCRMEKAIGGQLNLFSSAQPAQLPLHVGDSAFDSPTLRSQFLNRDRDDHNGPGRRATVRDPEPPTFASNHLMERAVRSRLQVLATTVR